MSSPTLLRLTRALLLLVLCVFFGTSAVGATSHAVPTLPPTMGAVNQYLYPHLHNLVWDPTVPGRVFATSPIGGWRSDDSGMTWSPVSDATPNLHYGRMLVDRGNGTMYLYRTNDWRLYRSTDRGGHWEVRSDDLFKEIALDAHAPGQLYAVNGDWKIRRSNDGGATWQELAQPLAGASEVMIAVAAGTTGTLDTASLIYALADRRLYVSRDAGASWQPSGVWPHDATPRELALADDGALVALIASDDTPSVSAKALWRSTDGGATWVAASLPTPRIAVITLVGTQIWAGSDDGRLWRTVDLTHWGDMTGWRETPIVLAQPVALRDDIPYTPTITDIAPGPNGVVLIGTIHGVYRAAVPDGPAVLRARGLLPTAPLPTNPVPRPTDATITYFPETGHTLREPFLTVWKRAGKMQGLGFPRSELFIERNEELGRDLLVQYFERGRLEFDSANNTTSIGRLGQELMEANGQSFPRMTARRGCQYVKETGYNLCGRFPKAWQTYGGVATLGYPLSEAIQGSNGQEQWFERGRIANASNAAFLCLIGSEELHARGWLP